MSRSADHLQPTDLEGVITTLQFMHDICLQKRRIYEKINQDCLDVLKPWPTKKGHGQSEQEKEGTKQVAPTQQKELLPEEKLGLTLVEKALAKAERTRNRFKVKEDHSVSAEKERPKSLKASVDSSKVVASKQKDTSSSSSSKDTPLHIQHKDAYSAKSSVGSSISRSQVNSILQLTRTGASSLMRPGSGKTRYTPVHVRAPFRTQQEVKGRRSVIQVRSADKSNQKDNVSVTRKEPVVGTKPQSLVSGRTTVVNKDCQHHIVDSDVDNKSNAINTPDNLTAKGKVDNRSHDVPQERKNGPNVERFCLLRHGKQLSMPIRYKRLLTKNQRLQDKLISLYTSSSVSPPVSLDVFIKRLQQSIDDDISTEAFNLRKILSLINAYYTLHRLILQVPLSVVTSYDLDWREVLAYVHKLELVLNGVASLETYYEKLIVDCPKQIKPYDQHTLSKPKLPVSTLCWIPEHIGSVPVHCCCLKYTTRKQLIKYTTLLHQIQVLLLEKHVLQQMEDILEKFSHATGKESWFVSVYRALYGMLCSSGRSFPTIVMDTIDSSDDEDDG